MKSDSIEFDALFLTKQLTDEEFQDLVNKFIEKYLQCRYVISRDKNSVNIGSSKGVWDFVNNTSSLEVYAIADNILLKVDLDLPKFFLLEVTKKFGGDIVDENRSVSYIYDENEHTWKANGITYVR